jgi:hypothetical protein
MAISRKSGWEYESRRERGTRPDKRPYKPARYPAGFDRWGQPTICGVIDEFTGKECRDPVEELRHRCPHHQARHEEKWSGTSGDGEEHSS